MKLHVVILAAGKGTRMRSAKPKVLHRIGGRPMVHHVIECAQLLSPEGIHVVHGHEGEQVIESCREYPICWIEQTEQKGTGHAVIQAMPGIPGGASVLVLYGDVPLIRQQTLQRLLKLSSEGGLALLTAEIADPHGYGRILRDSAEQVVGIVEEKDASAEQKLIREINSGILAAPANKLAEWLGRIKNNNSQGEYYLTDIVTLAVKDGVAVEAIQATDDHEIQGVNSRSDQTWLERTYQRLQAATLMEQGVALADDNRIDIRGTLSCGQDVHIDVNAVFEGKVKLGSNVTVGANCIIRNSKVADGVVIRENSVIENAVIGEECIIGPFARIRPDSVLEDHVHVGNFVELKKAHVKSRSKINHLSYVGDSTVGKDVNIGAGTITCNYDGANKHHTEIGDRVFVGSDTQLVAPVEIGAGVTIGAGTTVTENVPPDVLVISRVRQKHIQGWKRPVKKGK